MPSLRRSAIALGGAGAVAVALAAGPASAANPVRPTVCDSTLSDVVIRGDVYVPYDADCTLTNVVVTGALGTETDAGVVTLDRTAVTGDVRTQGRRLVLRRAAVGGAVVAREARDGVRVTGSAVRGSLETRNVEGELTLGSATDLAAANVVGGDLTVERTFVDGLVAGNAVAGDLAVRGSAATTTVRRNVVRGALACADNVPAPVGGANLAGAKTGQCSGL